MAEIRWWWQSPIQDEIEETQQNARIEQAKVLQDMINSAPQVATNLQGLVNEHFYLPKDVLVGASLMNLTAESPEIATIIQRWLDVEKTWWDKVKAVGRGTIRTAFTAFDSLQDEIVKKPVLAYQKYLNQKKYRDSTGILGATLQLLISDDARKELGAVRNKLGPSIGREAVGNLVKGKKVNLGEGYFPNSTLAENTDVYKELVGRGVNPDEVKKIVQTYYGQDITNNERERDEGLTIQTRFGTTKLTPAAQLTANILEPGTKGYNIMSGLIDGAFTLIADPTILIGSYLSKAGKAVRSLNQADVLKSAGIVNKAVRKTIHVPSATEYLTATKGGRRIVDQLVLADNYDDVGLLLRNQGDAALHKKLKNAKSTQEVTDALIPAIEESVMFKRLDPNSLMMKGNLSSALGKFVGGDFGQATGLVGAIRKTQDGSALGRLFQPFPVPKLNVKDLNQTFFDLKQWMKWAKVDDEVAYPALDALAEMAERQMLNPDEAQALTNMGMILDIWNGVLTHIGTKFESVGLPPQMIKGVKRWMASIDETHRYFVNELGELEWFPGSKFEQIPKKMKQDFSEYISDEDTYTVVEKVLAKFRGDTQVITDDVEAIVKQIKDISNDPTAVETQMLVDEIWGGFYEGAERTILNIAEDMGIVTRGRVPKGYATVDGKVLPKDIKVKDVTEELLITENLAASINNGTVTAVPMTIDRHNFIFKFNSTKGVNLKMRDTVVQVNQTSNIPVDILTNPEKTVLLNSVLDKTGMDKFQLQEIINANGKNKFFKLIDFDVVKGSRYDNNARRMRELGLDDFLDSDEYVARQQYNQLRNEALESNKSEINALPRKEKNLVQAKIQRIDDAKKTVGYITKAIEDIKARIVSIEAEYAPTSQNIRWYMKNYMGDPTEVKMTEAMYDEATAGLLRLKKDALNQAEMEIQKVTVYRTQWETKRGGRRVTETAETSKKTERSKVPTGPPIKKIGEQLALDRKAIQNEITRLEDEISQLVPSFKKANEVIDNQNIYDPDYWGQDFGAMNPKSTMASVVKSNIEATDGTIMFLSGTRSSNLLSVKNYLDTGSMKLTDDVKLTTGIFQGNKPHIVIDLTKPLSKDEIAEMQKFIFRNRVKKLNVVGSKDIDNVQAVLMKNIMEDLMYYQTKNQRATLGKLNTVLEANLDELKQLGKTVNDEEPGAVINSIYEEFVKTTSGKVTQYVNEPQATAHLLSEYWDEGYIPMPDARLFLRVFRPMRDLGLKLSGRGRNISDEAYDKLLAKPVTKLAELEVKGADRTTYESIRRLVGKTRLSFKLNADGDDVSKITEGMLTMIGDGYMQLLWKPSILLRPAWVTRVVGEEQIRMWADGLDNVFAHPLSAFSWIFGRSPERNRQLFLSTREKGRHWLTETWGRGNKDILDETMEQSFFHQEAMSQTNNGVLIGINPRRSRGFITKNKEQAGFYSGWTSELLQLAEDPIAPLIAKIILDPTDPKFARSIKEIKESFWSGDLSKWRKAYVGNSDERVRYIKSLINKNRAYADSYIDSIVARVHLKTGGKYEAFEIMPNGTKVRIDTRNPAVMEVKNPIEYRILEGGDRELLDHISVGANPNIGERKIQYHSRKADGIVERLFTRNMTRSDFNSYSSYLSNYKSDLIDNTFKVKASRFDMDGDRLSQYNQVLETMFTTLMGASTNELSRSTAFRQYYWRFIQNAYANMDEAARAYILPKAKTAMGKYNKGSEADKYIKNLEKMGFADVSKQIGLEDIEQVDTLAKAYALEETKSLLYDLNKRHVISDMLRLAFPFAEVYLEIAGTWTRLLKGQKTLMGRKMQRTVEGLRKPSIFGENEDEGFFSTDPQTGEEMYNAPGFGLNNKLDRQLQNLNPENAITNPLTGREDLDAPNINARIEGYASGLNMVAGSIVPGLGPLVSLPASAMLPSNSAIDKALFPYGRPEFSKEDVGTYFIDTAFPTWINRLRALGGSSNPELQRAYANQVKTIQRAMFATGIYDDSTPEAEQKSLEQARKLANSTLKYQAFIAFVAPTPAVVNYEYEVGPEGAAFLDPFKAKKNDPQHKFFADTLFADAYYQMLAKRDGDRVSATADFIKTFGFDPTALLVSKSKKIQTTSYTVEGGYFYKENKSIMDKYPDVSYYLLPDSPLGEFNYQAWADAFTTGKRVDLTDTEFKRAVRQAQGSLAYENARRLLLDTNVFSSVPIDKKFEQLYLTKLDLQKKFPGYGTTSSLPTSMDMESKIQQLTKMINNEAGNTVKLPNGELVAIENLPSIQGAMQYLLARDQVLRALKSEFGANASLSRAEAKTARAYLSNISKRLMMQYPDFYYIWYDVFRLEIEEEAIGGIYA